MKIILYISIGCLLCMKTNDAYCTYPLEDAMSFFRSIIDAVNETEHFHSLLDYWVFDKYEHDG